MTFESVRLGECVEASAVRRVLDDRLTFVGTSLGQPVQSRDFLAIDFDFVFVAQSQQSVHDLPRRVHIGRQVATRRDRHRVIDQLRQVLALNLLKTRSGLLDDFRLRTRKQRSWCNGRFG